jgi:hypothetical protein
VFLALVVTASYCVGLDNLGGRFRWFGLAGSPRILLSNPRLDLGAGIPGETLAGSIPIKNDGNEPLVIKNVQATCGCSTFALPKREIAPGESVEMEMGVSLRAEGEQIHVEVSLHSNDPTTPIATCDVFARVIPIMRSDPELIQFGTISRGAEPECVVKLFDPNGQPWPFDKPVDVKSLRGLATVSKEIASFGQGEGQALRVKLLSDLPNGDLTDVLRISPAGSPRAINIPIKGQVIPRILAVPSSLYLSVAIDEHAQIKRPIVLRDNTGKSLGRLLRTNSPDGITVSHPDPKSAAGDTMRLNLIFDPTIFRDRSASCKVMLTLENEPTPIEIQVTVAVPTNK